MLARLRRPGKQLGLPRVRALQAALLGTGGPKFLSQGCGGPVGIPRSCHVQPAACLPRGRQLR